jgi:hypothetical protein
LTKVGGGATVGSSSPAAVRSPLRIARCGACSDRRSQTTVRSHFSNHFLVVPSCDVSPLNRQPNRTALRSQARRRSDRAARPNHHAATAVRLSEVDASGDALSAPITVNKQRHRRSEWAGVSWPKDDDREPDAAGGGALARKQGKPHTPIPPQMLRSVRLFARWRARPHVSASSEN